MEFQAKRDGSRSSHVEGRHTGIEAHAAAERARRQAEEALVSARIS
jgi:hypothetical protein